MNRDQDCAMLGLLSWGITGIIGITGMTGINRYKQV